MQGCVRLKWSCVLLPAASHRHSQTHFPSIQLSNLCSTNFSEVIPILIPHSLQYENDFYMPPLHCKQPNRVRSLHVRPSLAFVIHRKTEESKSASCVYLHILSISLTNKHKRTHTRQWSRRMQGSSSDMHFSSPCPRNPQMFLLVTRA